MTQGGSVKDFWKPSLIGSAMLFASLMSYRESQADTGWEGAARIENGRKFETNQVLVGTITTAGIEDDGTLLASASLYRPCIKIKNQSRDFRVFIGSTSTRDHLINEGFMLEVSTAPGSSVELQQMTGAVYAFGTGPGSVAKPTVSVLECKSQ
jgi:hypothetical protein